MATRRALTTACAAALMVARFAAAQQTQPATAPADLAAFAAKGHPRLMLDAQQIRGWRAAVPPDKQAMWQRLLGQVERLRTVKAPAGSRLGRGDGNMMASLAVLAKLSGDEPLAAAAKEYLLDLASRDVWDPDTDLLHGHLLWGGAIAYDWLYGDLSEAERAIVRERLGREAQLQYEASGVKRGYWRNQYLQNHGHVNLCGLAFAAAGLYGEDDRAADWLTMANEFFTRAFAWSNQDGTSIEGLSYGMYALEFCLRYAELARQLYGKEHGGIGWFANAPLYVLHSTLPVMTEDEWAMTFGDSPRAANSHLPVHSLARIASVNRDPVAQGASRLLMDLHGGIGRDGWQTVLWLDPALDAKDRAALPTFHHFADTGQVMMRTGWDRDAMLVGLRCGPWLGHNLWGRAKWDYGAAHEHPDVNSFQVFAGGAWLLIDPGYTYVKRTSDHGTLLVDGHGQLGGDVTWFASEDALTYDHYAKILRAESREQYDYVAGDGTHAYHPGLGLTRFVRHWLFIKPIRTLVVVDDVATEPKGYYKAYTRGEVESEGMRIENPRREFLAPANQDRRGRVWFEHGGPDGVFQIDVDYFDNWPGEGHYVLAVNDEAVEEWVHQVQDTDLHVRIVKGVTLHKGDRVELRGEPFGRPGKFIKMVVWGRDVPRDRPHDLTLNLHAPADAKVVARSGIAAASAPTSADEPIALTIQAGGACLDIAVAQPGVGFAMGPYTVEQASQIRRTQRLQFIPEADSETLENSPVVVAVLHARKPEQSVLGKISVLSKRGDRSVSVSVAAGDATWEARMALEGGRVRLDRNPAAQSGPARE